MRAARATQSLNVRVTIYANVRFCDRTEIAAAKMMSRAESIPIHTCPFRRLRIRQAGAADGTEHRPSARPQLVTSCEFWRYDDAVDRELMQQAQDYLVEVVSRCP